MVLIKEIRHLVINNEMEKKKKNEDLTYYQPLFFCDFKNLRLLNKMNISEKKIQRYINVK